jgi:AmiR/NasT family two-component response regulator
MEAEQSTGTADELTTLACEVRDHGGNHVQLYRLAELTVKHLEQCESELEQTRLLLAGAERALATSRDIGMAMGVLMGRHAIDSDAAFTLLRDSSQHSQVKIRDLAIEFLRTGQLP